MIAILPRPPAPHAPCLHDVEVLHTEHDRHLVGQVRRMVRRRSGRRQRRRRVRRALQDLGQGVEGLGPLVGLLPDHLAAR